METNKLDIVIENRKLTELSKLKNNAHYMDKAEFDQLVANIARDGVLTSLPVVYDQDIPGEILSGNHRVEAAIKAGIETADVIVIKSKLTKDQKIGLQLSHNAIHGKDDPNLLKVLYDSIESIDFKAYSGLTDDSFKVNEIDLNALSFGNVKAEDLTISFLPEDKQAFIDNLERIKKLAKKQNVIVANRSDFDLFFETMLTIKSEYAILNHSIAINKMLELANKQIELERQEKAQNDGSEENTDN